MGLADLCLTEHPDGSLSLHATSVSLAGRALIIVGPSGAGKSGLAAQLIVAGGALIADDLTRLERVRGVVRALAHAGGPPETMELRGLGLCRVPRTGATEVGACLVLGPSRHRLPDPEHVSLLGRSISVLRHPVTPDLPAKLLLWFQGQDWAS